MVNVIKLRSTLNFLILATLTMMDTFLTGYKKMNNAAVPSKDSGAI
jgi:hypothetical protein